MANNPFTSTQNVNNNVPRSVYDQSHQVNLTTALGRITPFMCKEILPGDSARITPELGLRFMPMVFPIQTRMRAYVHFFYVRNRTLWKDWQDFIYGTKKNLQPPYLSTGNGTDFATSSLGDYLGLPSYLYGDFSSSVKKNAPQNLWEESQGRIIENSVFPFSAKPMPGVEIEVYQTDPVEENISGFCAAYRIPYSGKTLPDSFTFSVAGNGITGFPTVVAGEFQLYVVEKATTEGKDYKGISVISAGIKLQDSSNVVEIPVSKSYIGSAYDPETQYLFLVRGSKVLTFDSLYNSGPSGSQWSYGVRYSVQTMVEFDGGHDLGDLDQKFNPFINGKRPISALPFRAYEAIYNSFYRNQQNDPFRINGEIEYNKWIPTDSGGSDSTVYKLYNRNWEQDLFTTCLPSPQAGDFTPLVGITTNGDNQITAFSDEDGIIHTVRLKYDEKGVVSADISDSDEDTIEGRTFYSLFDATTSGITINDLRSVNCLQKFLELQQRKGYRYKDLTKGHYDVDIKFDELMMPEFLGGFSQDVFVNQVTSTSATQTMDSSGNMVDAPLGSWAGNAGCVGKMNGFSKYFDEHGFLIGLLMVVPVPVYSQTMPKFFTKFDKFDYYFPEFANIGMQAVNKELLCPLQWFNQSEDTNSVFGYQRPWFEYCSQLDTVHGLFRSQLRNFVMNRVFDGVPTLGHDFLEVDPNQLNDVFVDTDNTDKILGEVYLHMEYKSSVPFVSLPRLD